VKKKRFSVEQITSALQQVGGGMPVGDVCRQVGISEQTFTFGPSNTWPYYHTTDAFTNTEDVNRSRAPS
jgi:hypothetical protein